VANEFNVLALIKGQERFVFVYDDASRADLIDTIRDLAADPALTKKAREQARSAEASFPEEIAAPRSRI
jgi:hypothetical protein